MSQAEPLHVVVTNDDGIDSEGLRLLAAAAVNIPNVPQHLLRGIRPGRLAAFGAVQIDIIEAGEDRLQVTMSEPEAGPDEAGPGETGPGTDSALLAAGYASVTPLQPVSETPAPWLPWPTMNGADVLATRE